MVLFRNVFLPFGTILLIFYHLFSFNLTFIRISCVLLSDLTIVLLRAPFCANISSSSNLQLMPQQLVINVTYNPRTIQVAKCQKNWCHNCLTCQQLKITHHIHPTMHPVICTARFTILHLNNKRPLPAIKNSPFDTFIGSSTKCTKSHPVHSIPVEEIYHTFSTCKFCSFGIIL